MDPRPLFSLRLLPPRGTLLLALVLGLACSSGGGSEPPPAPETDGNVTVSPVTGILITAMPTTLSSDRGTSVTALVEGFEVGDRKVTWKLIQGPGQLFQEDGRSASYRADDAFTGTVVLEATSNADPSRSATVTLTVLPPETNVISAELRQPGCWKYIRYWACDAVPAADSATVLASITSTYEVSAVARVPGTGREATLTASSGGSDFQGTLDLHSLSRGVHPLELSVADTRGNALVIPATFVIDRVPTVEVAEPATWKVATTTSMLRVRASCQDDAGACAVTASVDSLSATGSGTLDTTFDLTPFAGRSVQLTVSAKDLLGQVTSRSFSVFVASPTLEPVVRVPGQLVQAEASRLLFTTGGGSNTHPTGLAILQRASGQISPVLTPAASNVWEAQLTSSGVVFFAQPVSGTSVDRKLYEARPDVLLPFEPNSEPVWFKARGDYVLWRNFWNSALMLRRLSTGTTVRVAVAGNLALDVTEQGFVAFWGDEYGVQTYQDGVTRRLTNDARGEGPVTDGTRVVYYKELSDGTQVIAVHTGAEELLLTQPRPPSPLTAWRDYAVNAGWVAYTDRAPGGQKQVWLRSPAGETRKVTDWSTPSTIEALGPEGQLAVRNSLTREDHLHVSRGSEPLQDLGPIPLEARALWLDGAWHILWADTLFRVR
jgi:hypothetical protein